MKIRLFFDCPGDFRPPGASVINIDTYPGGNYSLRSDYRQLREAGVTRYLARAVLVRQAIRCIHTQMGVSR